MREKKSADKLILSSNLERQSMSTYNGTHMTRADIRQKVLTRIRVVGGAVQSKDCVG